jgi:methylated-DNA-[protein]-cysteine S-methyltransferase
MKSTHFTQMNSPIGAISLCGTEHGLAGIFMEDHCHGPSQAEGHGWHRADDLFAEVRAQLEEYFAGRRTVFSVDIGRNPLSIIVPCHRVIGSDGKLTGYGGGMDRKRWLLDLESCAVQSAGVMPSLYIVGLR